MIQRNPYRRSDYKKVLRIDKDKSMVELVSDYPILEYTISYMRKPKPIILTDLKLITTSDVSINGIKDITECELNPILHRDILERAV